MSDGAEAAYTSAVPVPQGRTGSSRSWLAAIGHRWPTWLALAMVAVSVGGEDDPTGLSEGLLVFALGYLGAAVVQRRQATWLVAVVAIGPPQPAPPGSTQPARPDRLAPMTRTDNPDIVPQLDR